MDRLTRAARAALLLGGLGLAITACDRGADAGEGPYAREVAERVPLVEEAVGLEFRRPPRLEVRSREQLREFLLEELRDSTFQRELEGQSAAYKLFGLLPDTLDVRRLLVDVLTEQVAGYYDPEVDVLYVVEGGQDDLLVTTTITHELVHALQDQYLPLDSLQDVRGDNDRQVAAQAFIEGQATYEQLRILTRGNIAAVAGGWDGLREQIRAGTASSPVLATAPLFIQETLVFPYLSGAEFVHRWEERHPDDAPPYDRLPISTEQILHIEAYEQNDRPTPVVLPAPRGGEVVYENNLGEFETRMLLYGELRDLGASARAAAGWDGDRYVVVRTPQGLGLAWATVWDTAVDAGEFLEQIGRWAERRTGAATPAGGTGTRRTYAGQGRRVVIETGEIEGRPVVLVTDVPAGAAVEIVPLSGVRLGRE